MKAVPDATTQDLDLNRADDEQFPPEKLRMTLERFYTSVVVGLIECFRHVGRLRSWKEPVRTSLFCAVCIFKIVFELHADYFQVYTVSWALDLLIPTTLSLIVALILCPPIRCVLFPPPAPDPAEEPLKRTDSGQPQSQDSLTGASESHKGEAAEQEAKNLVDSFATVAMESAAGRYGQAVAEDATEKASASETLVPTENTDVQTEEAPEDKTKKPMKQKVSQGTDQAMRVISDITDVYEKFSK